jgi:K(+)-stimulated pyrophosphate-energized sodium pump
MSEPVSTLAAIGTLPWLYYLAPLGGLCAIVMARVFTGAVLRHTEGDEEQRRIAQFVREGAIAYLRRQYRVVAIVFVALVAVLGVLSFGLHLQPALSMVGVPIAGLLSGLCGWLGMRMATNASARTAAAAKESLNDALTIAFRAGSVLGLNVVGFALLDVSVWFFVLQGLGMELGFGGDIRDVTTVMLSFAMGASLQALFARVGGGIYTKAADVGADLVGKVEAGIPEDDARNPATIADNVGDNVGDVAGMGADLYESYYGSILSTAALGAAAAFTISHPNWQGRYSTEFALSLVVAPLALAGVGIIASILGIFAVRTKEGAGFAELLGSLNRGIHLASLLIIAASFAIPYVLFGDSEPARMAGLAWWGVGVAICAGLVAGLVIARATEYYTSYEHPPTRRIAIQAQTGPATVIIGGIAEGMKSTWAALVTIVIAIIAAFIATNGAESFLLGLYGVGIAAVGMLATLGITLATDAYGPIADNAGGNAEMSGQPTHVRQRTDMLDSLGNTTAAIGKGFAIGSAALTALALFAAYVQIVQVQQSTQGDRYARQRLRAAGHVAPDDVRAGPHAYYQGYGKFAVVIPAQEGSLGETYTDGAMLVDRAQLPADRAFQEAVRPGMVFALELPAAHEEEHEEEGAGHEEHEHEGPAPTFRTARTLIASMTVDHGEHKDHVEVAIITARNGSINDVLGFYDVTLTNPRVLGGLFIGTLLTFLFCALTMQAVGRAAYAMMGECRRQFGLMREALRRDGMSEERIADPENWPKRIEHEGKQYPDYATCVSISTAGAQREMIFPSLLAILVPLAVGLVLSVPGVMGMLAGGLASGFAVAIFMANAGGAWDNAKKFVESFGRISADKLLGDPELRLRIPAEIREQVHARAVEFNRAGRGAAYVYGKGSDDHKATVVGDTVGDPFKDTSGPSLNILIKLISIVSVVFAGLVVKFGPVVGQMIGLD